MACHRDKSTNPSNVTQQNDGRLASGILDQSGRHSKRAKQMLELANQQATKSHMQQLEEDSLQTVLKTSGIQVKVRSHNA